MILKAINLRHKVLLLLYKAVAADDNKLLEQGNEFLKENMLPQIKDRRFTECKKIKRLRMFH